MNLVTALLTCLPSGPSPKAIWRAWNGWKPVAGSIATLRIFSGCCAATSSISMPPSVEAMMVTREVARSISGAEIELARDVAAFLDIDALDTLPCGPVCLVTSVMPSIAAAAADLGGPT